MLSVVFGLLGGDVVDMMLLIDDELKFVEVILNVCDGGIGSGLVMD